MRIRRQEGYLLQKIGKTVYLLPYGQKIADQKRGMELNETALRLWEMLEQPQTVEALTDKMAAYYEIPKEEQGELAKDIEAFVQELLVFGAVRRELGCPKGSCEGRLHIAGIKIEVYGEKGCIPKQFDAFRMTYGGISEKASPDLILELAERLPGSRQNGTILIRNRDLTVAIWEEGYVFRFDTLKNIYEIWMKEDGSYARIYYRCPINEEEQDSLFLAIRPVFLFLAQRRGMFALHSASLLYLEKAWLFSGPSGMGKSTHTALWKKLFATPFLNGDLNLIGKEGEKFFVYGIPWCGTSKIFTTEKKELGGIVLLEKAPSEELVSLTEEQKTLRVMQRMISPPWTAELMVKNLKFAEAVAKEKPVYFLRCTKNDIAAETIRRQIEEDEKRQKAGSDDCMKNMKKRIPKEQAQEDES